MMTNARRSRAHFQRGGGGVFRCECCGRSTRRVDQPGESCMECYELAGLENVIFDGGTVAEVADARDDYLSRIVKLGGNADAVRRSFTTLFPVAGQ